MASEQYVVGEAELTCSQRHKNTHSWNG